MNYSKHTLRMIGYHFFSLDKNGQIFNQGFRFKMADIECIIERYRVFWGSI